MKNTNKLALTFFLFIITIISIDINAQVNRLLDIPPRLQWDNSNGYCGEESIQMIGLYYGNYISQQICRNVAGGELLVGDNDETALNALSFNYQTWDYNQAQPQYQNYLVWVKQQLNNFHPVIITVFYFDGSDPDYDHIVPAIGFNAANINTTFNGSDELIFNDCYETTAFTQKFDSLWDTRDMIGNAINYDYCVPRDVDYGTAVIGIKDAQGKTKPVHLSIDRWDEPNVSLGESPVKLNATINISGLTVGINYALLRYNTYTHVPSSDFNPLNADGVRYFSASAITKTYTDTFMSNSATFYRCIAYNSQGIEVNRDLSSFNIYPNPINENSKIYFDLPKSQNVYIKIYDIYGKEIIEIADTYMNQGKHELSINCNTLAKGSYLCYLKTDNYIKTIKIEVVK